MSEEFETVGALAVEEEFEPVAREEPIKYKDIKWTKASETEETDFETVGEVDTKSVYAEERNDSFGIPRFYDPVDSEFAMQTEADLAQKTGFFGKLQYVNELGKDFGKGFTHFVATLPEAFGVLIKEKGEVLQETPDVKGLKTILIPFLFQKGKKLLAEKTQFDEALIKSGQNIIDQNKEFVKKLNLELPASSNRVQRFAFDLGAGFGSLGASIGTAVVTKNPALSALFFGYLQKSSIYKEAKQKGLSALEAKKVSDLAGAAEAGLEFVGLHVFLGAAKTSKAITRIAIRSAEEAIQEASQTLAEETITNLRGIRKTKVIDIAKRTAYSASIGALIGAPVATVVTFAEQSGVKKDLKNLGLDEKQADAFVEKLIERQIEEGLINETANIINKETDPLSADPEATQEIVNETVKKVEAAPEIEFGTLEEAIRGDFGTFLEARKKEVAKIEKVVEEKDVVIEAKEERVRVLSEKQEAIKTVREGFRTKQLTQEQLKQELISIAKERLELKDRGKFLSAVKNIKTELDLQKQIDRIEKLVSQRDVREFKGKIKKVLQRSKPMSQAGKPVGKFTPEIQRILDQGREAIKLTQAQADEMLNSMQRALREDEIPTPEQALQNRILSMMAGLENKNPQELSDILFDLEALTTEGRAVSSLGKLAQQERRIQMRERAFEVIEGDRPPDPKRIKTFREKLIKKLSTLKIGQSMTGWDDLMDILSQDDKTSKEGESDLNKMADVFPNETSEKKGVRIASQEIVKDALNSFGFTKERQVFNRLHQDSQIQNLGTFVNTAGKEVTLELSKAEARKRWMEFQDPTLQETLTLPEGNAYSPEMIKALETFLTAEDKLFAEAQLKFYRQFYKRINKTYSRIYGIDLPFNDFYSPISRKIGREQVADAFLRDIEFRLSVATGSLKARKENVLPLREMSDIQVLQKHIIEMEHFINWADKVRDLNTIFGDKEIRELIADKFGPDTMQLVDKFIVDFTRGGLDKARAHERSFDRFRRRFTVSVLAIKPVSLAVKQMVSIVAYADFVTLTEYATGLASFVKNPLAAVKPLLKSELLKARGPNITRDIKDAMNSEEFRLFQKKPSFKNAMLFSNRMGDLGAILMGGSIVYRAAIKQGQSKDQAMETFERATAKTQQSADLSQLSDWQRGNTFAKLFTMFTSSQNQYFRIELGAVRNLIKKRIGPKEFAKKMLIYHVLLHQMFQLAANFGKWDEKDQLRALILGSLNGVFVIKDVLDNIFRALLGQRIFDNPLSALGFVTEIGRSLTKIDFEDIELEEVLEALKDLSEDAVGPLTGLPIKQVFNTYEAVQDILDDELASGLLKLAGWSPWTVEKQLEE
jgi:hypothetical protein